MNIEVASNFDTDALRVRSPIYARRSESGWHPGRAVPGPPTSPSSAYRLPVPCEAILRALGSTIPADEVALTIQHGAGFANPPEDRLSIRMVGERRSRPRLSPVRELSIRHARDASEWTENRWAGHQSRLHLRAVLWRDAGRTVLVDLIRSAPIKGFHLQDVLTLRQILPGLALALRASLDCAPSLLATDLFERLPIGIALLDAEQRILFQNVSMRRLLARREALVADSGVLWAQSETGQHDLARAVRQVLDGTSPPRSELIVLPRTCGNPPYLAAVERFDGSHCSAPGPRQPLVRLSVADPDHSNEEAISRVAEHFGLTQGETEVVQAMLLGLNVIECAARLELAISTVRWHLKRIFAKTGTAGRAELILLFVRGTQLCGG
ncbi:MAG: helix-turn-helix transcriptional regulator [Panacagrimonas sp.]